jgi:hypothetical protein
VKGPAGTNCADVMVVFGSAIAAILSHAVETAGVEPACALRSMTVRMLNMRGILTSPLQPGQGGGLPSQLT